MLQRAGEALDAFPREEREISALTLGLGADQLREFKRRLYELRQELLQAAASSSTPPERVVQINFQLFPLSRASETAAGSADADAAEGNITS